MSNNLSVESLSTPEKLALMERLWEFHRMPRCQHRGPEGSCRLQAANQDLPVMTVISYDGSDDWVDSHIMAARDCLMNETPPAPATKCPHCSFAAERLAYAAKAN
jgi:hypothetical protein